MASESVQPGDVTWHRITYNLEAPDDLWAPYEFTIGPTDRGSLLLTAAADPEVEVPQPCEVPTMSPAAAMIVMLDELVMPTLGEWDWHQPEMYEAYAMRVARDPTHEFNCQRYAGGTAQLRSSPAWFSPIEQGQVVTARFALGPDDAKEMEALVRSRRGDDFVEGVLSGRYYPPLS